MKPVLDLALQGVQDYRRDSMLCNRMLKYWGTTYIDGIEVINTKFHVYPRRTDKAYYKIEVLFGINKSIKSVDFYGIDKFYYFINPSKASPTISQEIRNEILIAKIDSYLPTNSSIVYTLVFQLSKFDYELLSTYSLVQVYSHIVANYDRYVDSLVNSDSVSVLADMMANYSLFDNNQHLTNTFTKMQLTATPHEHTEEIEDRHGITRPIKVITYTYSIAIEVKTTKLSNITLNSNIVNAMKNEARQYNIRRINKIVNSTENYANGEAGDYIPQTIDSVWYKGQLRASAIRNKEVPRKQLRQLILKCMDTDYKKKKPPEPKKAKWWQRALAPILFVVALFFAPWTAGASLAAWAAFFTVVTVAFTMLSLAMSIWGDTASATYMGKFAKVTGITATVLGIGAVIQGIFREIAAQGLVEYIKSSITKAVDTISSITSAESGSLVNQAVNYVKNNTMSVVNNGLSAANKVMRYWAEKRTEKQAKLFSTLGATIQEQQNELAKLTDKENHLGIEDIKNYTRPLMIDNIQFEVDYLYEPTTMNICRSSFVVPTQNIRSQVFKTRS